MVLTATTVATIDVVTTNFIGDEDLTERECVRSRSRSFAHKKISWGEKFYRVAREMRNIGSCRCNL